MTTYSSAHPVLRELILSVRVRPQETALVFVVTADPAVANAVRDLLDQHAGEAPAVIWLTSMESALRRLAWGTADMVIVDEFAGPGVGIDALAELQTASPKTRVLAWAEDAVRL